MTHERAAAEAEDLPRFNEHTSLPWRVHIGRMADGQPIFGFKLMAGEKMHSICNAGCYEHEPFIVSPEMTHVDDRPKFYTAEEVEANAAFILHACNTYYDRLSALSAKEEEVRGLVEALRLAINHLVEPTTVTLEYIPPASAMRRAADAFEKREADIRTIQNVLSKHTRP